MPGNDKTVKFVFEVDQASVNNVKRAFTEIVNASKAMADALKSAGAGGVMGGGNVGARPAAGAGSMQAAAAAQKNTIKLDVIGPDAAKNFKDFVTAVKAGANDIKTSLGPTIQLIANLNSQLAQLKASAGSTGGAGGNIQSPSWFQPPTGTVVGGQQAPLQTFLVNQAAAAQATGGGAGMGMGGGGGTGMGALSALGGIFGIGGLLSPMGLAGTSVYMMKRMGIAGLNDYQDAPMGTVAQGAIRNNLIASTYSSVMNRDYKYGYMALTLASHRDMSRRVFASSSTEKSPEALADVGKAGMQFLAAPGTATGGALLSTILGNNENLSGVVTQGRALIQQLSDRTGIPSLGLGRAIPGSNSPAGTALMSEANLQNNEAAAMLNNFETAMASMSAKQRYALDQLSSEMPSRIRFARTFGLSRHRAMGLDLSRPVMGTGANQTQDLAYIVDEIKDLEQNLEAAGYSKEEWGSAKLSALNVLGRGRYGQHGYSSAASAIMGARGAGFSGFEGIANASIRAGYGMQGFNTAMGFGDPIAGRMIGEAVIGQGWSPDQFTGGLGVMAAMQNAPSMFGQQWNINSASRAIAGMESGIRNTNLDPATRSNNIIAAIKATRAMGPAGDIGPMGQDMLANLSRTKAMDILASGQVPEGLRNALGPMAYEMIEQYVQNTGPSTMLTARTGMATAGGGMTNTSKWLGRLRDTGGLAGLYQAYKNDPAAMAEAQSALGTALANITGSSIEAGIGEIGQEFGFLSGKGATMGRGPFGAIPKGSTEEQGAKTSAEMIEETKKSLTDMGSMVNMAIKYSKPIVEVAGQFSEMKSTVTDLQVVFGKLAQKLNHDFNLGVALKPGPK